MGVYDTQIDNAFRLIKQKGRLVTISRTTSGSYDPATGSTSSGTTTTMELYGVTLPATLGRIESFEKRFVEDSSLIKREVRFLMLASKDSTFNPDADDKVIMGGETYSVMGATRLSINGEDILYRLGIFK